MRYRVEYHSPRIRKGNWRHTHVKFDTYEEASEYKRELEEMIQSQGSDLTFKVAPCIEKTKP